jgi:hypothetical protein
MTPLIAMPGPRLPQPGGPGEDTPGPPSLPALTQLARRARRLPDAADWRAGVLAALGAPSDLPAAALAARAVGLPEGSALCFAAPLHLVAGISRVHLPPGGWSLLPADEEQQWCADFNAEFGGPDLQLHVAAAGGGWLLQAPFAAAARDAAPETLTGAPLERHAAGSGDERALRRLAAEAEMWFAAHALNRQRERRGQPPINALWLWGGGRAGALPALAAPSMIATAGMPDAWLAGLAAHSPASLRMAGSFDAAMRAAPAAAAGGIHALLVPAPDGQGPTRQYWESVEENWIAPAWRALQAGEIDGLRLQIGRTAWQLPARGLFNWLRRERRAWWQVAGEVPA